MRPSLVVRPAFFAALASPRFRRMVFASSKSPCASVSADLHSIMPAPVWSRSFLTISAVIVIAIVACLFLVVVTLYTRTPAREGRRSQTVARDPSVGLRGRTGGLALAARHPRRLAPRLVARVVAAVGSLDVGRLLHVAAGKYRFGNPRREQPDGAKRVVVAWDDEVDLVGIAVGVDDADDRDLQLAGFVDGDFFLLRVHDEHGVGQAGHPADALEILRELPALFFVAGDLLLRER